MSLAKSVSLTGNALRVLIAREGDQEMARIFERRKKVGRIFLLSFAIKVAILLGFGFSLMQAVIWSATAIAATMIAWRIIGMVYPSFDKRAAAGEAAVGYDWSHAVALNSGYLVAWGFMVIASLLVW